MLKRRLLAGLAGLVLATVLAACSRGGNPPDAPTDLKVVTGDGQVTLIWTGDDSATWWVFYAPSSTISTSNWTTITGSKALLGAKSPQVVTGLTNGTLYAFVVNGRVDGGKGGAESNVVTATPRPAGQVWAPGAPIGQVALTSVAYVGTSYIAGGQGGTLWRSADALTWTAVTTADLSTADITAVFTAGDRLLIFAADGAITSTTDGAAFAKGTNPATSVRINGVAYQNSFVVAVGANGTILRAVDALSYGLQTSPTTATLRGVVGGNGRFVAVGDGGTILTSTDGASWSAVASGTTTDLTGVAYGNSTFVAVGRSGTWLSSVDGVTWTSRVPVTTANLSSVVFGSQFVAAGSGGTVLVSTDGVSWASVSSGTTADLTSVSYGGGRYIAVGGAGVNTVSQ